MFDEVLTLISYSVSRDKIGNEKKIEVERDILCQARSTTRYEFYNYGVADRVPEIIAVINKWDYQNEVECKFRDNKYKITRTYDADLDLLELTLERRVNQNE